ncbi:hypothetical protein COOONC_17521 [Cooperia oncophora]
MEKSNDGQVPDAAVEIYQMTREDLDDLLDQAREEAVQAFNALSHPRNSPPVSSGLGTSSMNLVQPVSTSLVPCTSTVPAGLGIMTLNPGQPARPAFKKAGLSRQYEFNAGVAASLAALVESAPESLKVSLNQVIGQLNQRNELLVIADTDPEVFEFYDQHSRAETLQSSNPILAAFLRERKKKECKKPAPRSTLITVHAVRHRADSPFGSEGRRGPAPLRPHSPPTKIARSEMQEDSVKAGQGTCVITVGDLGTSPRTVERPRNIEGQFQAGNIHNHFTFWSSLKLSSFVENVLLHGYSLDIKEGRYTDFIRSNSSSTLEFSDFVDGEISKLLASTAIEEVVQQDRGKIRVNPLMVAVGKKPRLILDLSHLNKSLTRYKVKFEDLPKVLPALPRGGYMGSFDLKAGYHHVRINPSYTNLLGFSWRGKFYKFLVLPFGLLLGSYGIHENYEAHLV